MRVHLYVPGHPVLPLCGRRHHLPLAFGVVIDEVTCRVCQAAYRRLQEKRRLQERYLQPRDKQPSSAKGGSR